MIPTEDEIQAAHTPNGGWTKAQLEEWGVSWPPPKGWKKKLVEQSRADALRKTHDNLACEDRLSLATLC